MLKELKGVKLPDINKIIEKYTKPGDVIPAMQDIQTEFGFVSEENMEILSKKIKLPLAKISGVATFYSMFRLKPMGKYRISICRGTACHVHNSETLLKHVEKKLNIKAGEVAKDGFFSVETVNCIGACAKAPAMMINDKVYGNLTEEKIDKIMKEIQEQNQK